ncbi:MAG: hypothetical protein KA419_13550 [Acidobacteria bacterium]|nr:hypothetical protein [Acidobacteriota bacterium]
MPVRKFRSLEDMKRERWHAPDDPVLPRILTGIWRFGRMTTGLHFPPGVYRHRTLEEMNALTDRWAEANFRAFQERRSRS